MISLIHPSRSRVQRSFETVTKWISRSSGDIEVIISIDENDPRKKEYLNKYANTDKVRIVTNKNRSAVDAINNGAKESKGDILIVVSDDTDCPYSWDQVIKEAVQGEQDYILKVYDGIQKWIITMPVMDRTYYNRFGYIYYPEYIHMFCDTEITHVADITRKVIWRNDILFPHLHYSVGKSVKDDVSVRADSSVNTGAELYLSRFRNNFGLQDVNVWKISAQGEGHLNWLKKKLQ